MDKMGHITRTDMIKAVEELLKNGGYRYVRLIYVFAINAVRVDKQSDT